MIDARNTTLNQRPKAFNAIGVDFATHIPLGVMFNPQVRISQPCHMVVAGELIREQNRIAVNGTSHEGDKRVPSDIGDDLSHHLAVSFHGTDDFGLTLSATTTPTTPDTAYISLVNLNFPTKLSVSFIKQLPYLREHSPSRLIGYASFTLDLLRRYATTCRRHNKYSVEPSAKRSLGLVEYGVGCGGHLSPAELAGIHLAVGYAVVLCCLLALLAENAVGEAGVLDVFKARFLVGELLIKVPYGIASHLSTLLFVSTPFLYHKISVMSRDNYQDYLVL